MEHMDKLHLGYHLRLRVRSSNPFAMVMGATFNDFHSHVTLYIALMRCSVYRTMNTNTQVE